MVPEARQLLVVALDHLDRVGQGAGRHEERNHEGQRVDVVAPHTEEAEAPDAGHEGRHQG